MRKLKFTTDFTEFADGSVLVETGKTRVLCTAMVDESVPRFLMNSGQGWVTGEYDMLPSSTPDRQSRAARKGRMPGRSSEIQRLIGRALRAVVDRSLLGERTIYIDCDVLQADGGTRTASINGGFTALYLACESLVKRKVIEKNPITDILGAISVGIVDGKVVVDLDYKHDSSAEVDLNVVMDSKGRLLEIQGTAEREPFSRSALNKMLAGAADAMDSIITKQKKVLKIK